MKIICRIVTCRRDGWTALWMFSSVCSRNLIERIERGFIRAIPSSTYGFGEPLPPQGGVPRPGGALYERPASLRVFRFSTASATPPNVSAIASA